MTESLASVTNAMRVLKAFSARHRALGVSELARQLALSKSTTHRLLATLTAEHFVEKDTETGRYRLGLAVYDLVAAASPGYDLTEAVLPPMSVLRSRTGETTQLAVLDGREVVYVERLQSMHSLRLFFDVGRRNSAHSTATGKVLLANLEPAMLDLTLAGWDLPARTHHTITDPDLLRKELAEIREQGWGCNTEEAELGVVSVSAPVRDGTGQVIAALSVAGPVSRMSPHLNLIIRAVVESAATASRRLGHKGRRS